PRCIPGPLEFDPTRHIPSPGKEVQRHATHVLFLPWSEASVCILVVTSLAVFDISPVIENGVPVLPAHENADGTIR
ncbi:hypothetical protein BDZ89DRAFT_940380, partial [Hymenopellis radicata]